MNTTQQAAINESHTASTMAPSHSRRVVSWGAVIAGMVIAVVVQLVLSLLGTGVGLSTVNPMDYSTPEASTLGAGAGIWWVVSSIVALFVGGWVAGHLSSSTEKTSSLLHGLLTWGLATLVTVYLLASLVGSVLRGGAAVAGKTADLAGAGIGAAAGPVKDFAKEQLDANGITLDSMKSQLQQLLAQTGKPALQPDAVGGQVKAAAGQLGSTAKEAGSSDNAPVADLEGTLQKIITSGKATLDQADRESVVNVVIARTGATRAEAEQRTDAWIKQYQDARAQFQRKKDEAEAKARQAAESAASASAKGAFGAAIALLLGAIAAAVGGLVARRTTTVVTDVHRTNFASGSVRA